MNKKESQKAINTAIENQGTKVMTAKIIEVKMEFVFDKILQDKIVCKIIISNDKNKRNKFYTTF